jgi:hypothetical protein
MGATMVPTDGWTLILVNAVRPPIDRLQLTTFLRLADAGQSLMS